MKLIAMLAGITLAISAHSSLAQQSGAIDIGAAQARMLERIRADVTRYASEIGIPQEFVTFCQIELHLKTYAHPTDGYIPLGVNYNQISDQNQLNEVIAAREAYERSFLTLCLANAKKILQDARR